VKFFSLLLFFLFLSLNSNTSYGKLKLISELPLEATQPFARIAFNQQGEFAFSVPNEEFTQTSIWFFDKKLQKPRKVFEVEYLVNSLQLTEDHRLVFENYSDLKVTQGAFLYDIEKGTLENLTGDFARFHHRFHTVFLASQANRSSNLYLSAYDAQDLNLLYRKKGSKFETILKDNFELGNKSGINFLFIPAFNDLGDIAIKVQAGAREEVLKKPSNQQLLIVDHSNLNALHRVADAGMPGAFGRLTNSVVMNNKKNVAFLAEADKEPLNVYFYDYANQSFKSIRVSGLEEFSPKINDQDRVIFLTRSEDQKRSVHLWNPLEMRREEVRVRKLLTEGETVDNYEIVSIHHDFFIDRGNEIYLLSRYKVPGGGISYGVFKID
jgi:hypothetical protein